MASQSAINVLEVCRVLRNVVRPVLHTVFCWGCERDTTKTLEEYLVNEKKMSKQNFKDHFNKAMIEIIRSDPSGDKFDICLLYACIRTACKNLAKAGSQVWTNEDETKLEYLCTALKNLRGEIIHNVVGLDEIEMKNCISNINNLTTRALDIAGTLYNKDRTEVQDVIKHMKEIITNISENPLICNQDDMYKELLESRGDNRDKIMKEGIKELRYQFLRLKSVDPVSWFTESQLSVEAVFTLLDVVKENHQLIHQEAVKYEQLLILETENGSIPSVLIVEGEAGAGKTTLARLLMREWAWLPEKRPTFFNLNTIDIILYFECRNKHISKFEDLLLVLVSNAACQMSNSDLIKSVLNMHVLIIADGLDEGNNNTDLLLSEIKTLIPISGNKLRILITTRPEKLYKLSILIGNVQRVHTRLTGISYKKRVEFVKKLHEEMISQNHSKQDTQGLVDFLQQSQARIGDHCRSPFMLTLLTYLWAVDPLQVNEVTTSTKLYTKLLNMLQRRLLGKLMNLNMETEEFLKTVIEKFLYVLYEVSLRTLLTGDVVLSSDCCEKIVHVCEDHRLPTEDMCAAFLAIDRQWTANGYKIFFTAPHKSIMEYYASLHVFHYIFPPKGDSFECELTELLTKYGKSLEEVREHLSIAKSFKKKVNIKECIEDLFQLGDENRILSDYQNVLIHFCGLLADNRNDALKDMAQELVELLKDSHINNSRWLDVVWESECDNEIIKAVASRINLQIVIRDGHPKAAIEMFPYLDDRIPVRISLDCEVQQIPHLTDLLDNVADRDCDVELYLNHQWKERVFGNSDNLLGRIVNRRCRLSCFAGNLNSLDILPNTVEKLKLSIRDNEHAKSIFSGLKMLQDRLNLAYIGVHIATDVDPKVLQKMPVTNEVKRECGTLWLSYITDSRIEWACRVARDLLPDDCKYNNLRFPRCSLGMESCIRLIESLAASGVAIRSTYGALYISSSIIGLQQEIELRLFTREKLCCDFHCSDETKIW